MFACLFLQSPQMQLGSGPELNVALQAFAGGFPFPFGLKALRLLLLCRASGIVEAPSVESFQVGAFMPTIYTCTYVERTDMIFLTQKRCVWKKRKRT